MESNIEERIQCEFGSTTKVLSFNTLRRRLNDGKTKNESDYISSKKLSIVLRNSDKFSPVDPVTIGCYKWYDARMSNTENVKITERVRNRINLWKMC